MSCVQTIVLAFACIFFKTEFVSPTTHPEARIDYTHNIIIHTGLYRRTRSPQLCLLSIKTMTHAPIAVLQVFYENFNSLYYSNNIILYVPTTCGRVG